MSEKIRLRNATCIIQCKSNVIIKVLINKTKKEKEGNKVYDVQPKPAF